ncbi:hypothetical protein [Streptomyces sp. RFCAC02]|uniref:hypothetical protein n=1 Tax=Streptomyces sp. RFCAC02 TaxID=2499143 RepID=UPI00101FEC06|nr:hypothetical protein [Streptomyces sp. RFCAC02]
MANTASARPSVRRTLRTLEGMLLRGGQRTALENARAAVLADRERAAARGEVERVLASVAAGRGGTGRAAVLPVPRP